MVKFQLGVKGRMDDENNHPLLKDIVFQWFIVLFGMRKEKPAKMYRQLLFLFCLLVKQIDVIKSECLVFLSGGGCCR